MTWWFQDKQDKTKRLFAAVGSKELLGLLLDGRKELTRKELADVVINLLKYDPDGWQSRAYSISYGSRLEIWIGDSGCRFVAVYRPHEDKKPLGSWWQRRQIYRMGRRFKKQSERKEEYRMAVGDLF